MDVGADGLTTVTPEQVDDLLNIIQAAYEKRGYETKRRKPAVKSTGRRDYAPSFEAIQAAVACIPATCCYDDWLATVSGIKGAAAPEDQARAIKLVQDWSAAHIRYKPSDVTGRWLGLVMGGWRSLSRLASELGNFKASAWDFGHMADAVSAMFNRYVWVERLARVADLETGDLLDELQFNVRNNHITERERPAAWAILTREPDRLQRAKGVTYRPNGPPLLEENFPGLSGTAVNRWRPPAALPPGEVGEQDIAIYLAHLAYLLPVEDDRQTFLNWAAWVVQNPDKKPNWALIIVGGQGVGKDEMLAPIRAALGAENVRDIGPHALQKETYWVDGAKLVVVQEMAHLDRADMSAKLKALISGPPPTVDVNIKYVPVFTVPNLLAFIFLTNDDDALKLDHDDRRFCVIRTPAVAQEQAYYARLYRFLDHGGAALVAKFLLERPLGTFDCFGRAPFTAAKEDMRRSSRTRLVEWIEDGIRDERGVFGPDIVTFAAVTMAADLEFRGHAFKPTRDQIAKILKRVAPRSAGQVRIGTEKATLWVLRDGERYRGLSDLQVRDLFLQRGGHLRAA